MNLPRYWTVASRLMRAMRQFSLVSRWSTSTQSSTSWPGSRLRSTRSHLTGTHRVPPFNWSTNSGTNSNVSQGVFQSFTHSSRWVYGKQIHRTLALSKCKYRINENLFFGGGLIRWYMERIGEHKTGPQCVIWFESGTETRNKFH